MNKIDYFIQNAYLYDDAVAFLASMDANHELLPKLQSGYAPIHEIFLVKALRTLKRNQNVPVQSIALSIDKKIAPAPLKSMPSFSSDDYKIIDKLRSEKAALWAKASSAQTMLCVSNKVHERFNFAQLIVDNFERHVSIMDDLTFYDLHGSLPKHYYDTPKKDSSSQQFKRVYTLRTYISRYRKKIDLCKSETKRITHQQKLDEYLFELKTLENEIGVC